jgi:hypothetical protein
MMPSLSSPLTISELQMIAPSQLRSYRKDRYHGEDQRVSLDFFALEDRALLRQIYAALLELSAVLKPHHDRHSRCRDDLGNFLRTPAYRTLMESPAHLGDTISAGQTSETANRVIHDLRGGAFQALSFQLQLFVAAPEKDKGIDNLYFLVRDHLKIMRHCVQDIDLERLKLDSLMRPHDTQLLVEKWAYADFHAIKRQVHVDLTCLYAGTLCESCLELASLDRIIYNLMNNAAQYASDSLVHFYILPVPEPRAESIRFIVANKVSEEQRRVLVDQFRNDLSEIFRGGFTTNGHGIGTRTCADFCSHAYGVFDFARAKEAGYFGARLVGDYFASWFHWPVMAA